MDASHFRGKAPTGRPRRRSGQTSRLCTNLGVWNPAPRLHVDSVWGKGILTREAVEYVRLVSERIAGEYHMIIRATETSEDHVPKCLEALASSSSARIVHMVKSMSGREPSGQFAELGEELWDGTHGMTDSLSERQRVR